MHRIRTLLWAGTAYLALAIASKAAQQSAPVVLAVDISRSLSAGELAAAGEKLSAVTAALPAETAVGLLVFADQPRWIAKPAAPGTLLADHLRALRPEGRFTLLHDALFAASVELQSGGTVVLVTDGRDENSASTLDDITRIYAERGIHILSIGAGSAPATRNLRRLALLSSGSYEGNLRDLDAAAVANSTRRALAAVPSASLPTAPPAVPTTSAPTRSTASEAPGTGAPAPEVLPAKSPAPTESASPSWFWPAVVGLALAAGVATWLLLRRRVAAPSECSRCLSELPLGASGECAACQESALIERLRGRPTAGSDFAIDAFLDTAVVPQWNLEERLERTAVMVDQPAIVVREPGEPPRSFGLPEGQAFAVGREAGRNTLAIPSVTLSAEHFRIVPDQGGYCLLDLQSTNGTFLNGQRVRAARLKPSDVIRAGQVEFDFTVQQQFAPRAQRTKTASVAS